MAVKIVGEVPEVALSTLRRGPEEFWREALTAAVCKWYELGRVSQARGAEILGVSRAAFMRILGELGVSPFQETKQDLEEVARRE
jgi:predicted HTH domain antitoxin